MSTNQKVNGNGSMKDDKTGAGHGQQGIDKSPGEETSGDTENVIQDTQKGKNKVDGNPEKESDQPADQ